jgi:hypothetical protein
LGAEIVGLARTHTFADLAVFLRHRADRYFGPNDNWRAVIQQTRVFLSEHDWRQKAGLTAEDFSRSIAALSPLFETWGDQHRLHRGMDWLALVEALEATRPTPLN